MHGAHVGGVDAAVDLHAARVRHRAAQLADAIERLGHELLAGQAGMDAHAEREIRSLRGRGGARDRRLRVERDARAEPEVAGAGDRARRVRGDLDVEGDAVSARLRDALEVLLWLRDHQVAVELAAALVDERRRSTPARPGRS